MFLFSKWVKHTPLIMGVFLIGCQNMPAHQHHKMQSNHQMTMCQPVTEKEVAALFDRWNASLQTGNPEEVAKNYAEHSILLPTLSNKPRITVVEKKDYFHHFLENKPAGTIDFRQIELGCNTAVDAGLYTFKFAKNGAVAQARYSYTYKWNGKEWLITSHHSSLMPEQVAK